jgi:hypothetical protein
MPVMSDRSIKYSEEYIRIKIEDLVREYSCRIRELNQHHAEALVRWKKGSDIGRAVEAAYFEELDTLRRAFQSNLDEVKAEFSELQKKFRHIRKDLIKTTLESLREMEFGLMNLTK